MNLNRVVAEVQQENERVRREVTELRQENAELREEMRIVLAGRKQLEELRKRVEKMRGGGFQENRKIEETNLDESELLMTSLVGVGGSSMSTSSPSVREVDVPRVSQGGMGLTIQGSGGKRRWHTRN